MSMHSFYLSLITNGFRESEPGEDTHQARMAFIGERIMGFCTYDDEMSADFADQAFQVASAISNGKTFEFIDDPRQYKMYLTMCNMPFFSEKIEWGTSVRGAWWKHNGITLDTCDLFTDEGQQIIDPAFTREDWVEFMLVLRLWAMVR